MPGVDGTQTQPRVTCAPARDTGADQFVGRSPGDHPMTGAPVSRTDGLVKVAGAARYTADLDIEGSAYGSLVQSTIARGRIRNMDTSLAEAAPGVIRVLTCLNAPPGRDLPWDFGEPLPILEGDTVYYEGQSIGIVVAETLEQACHAATLVRIGYDAESSGTDFEAALPAADVPEGREDALTFRKGDLAAGHQEADTVIEHVYETPVEHHHPMEPHATVAVWSDESPRLTLYSSQQGTDWAQRDVAGVFGLEPSDVRIVTRFVGGGFGSKLAAWPHVAITALAAREVGRPVRLALTREQMVTSVGHRPRTHQRVTLGARHDGTLTLHRHVATSSGSSFARYVEDTGKVPKMLYACPHREVVQRLARLDASTPTYMRGPGETSGAFGMESAMDELAVALGMDPIELRVANEPDLDPETGEPWSSRSVVECLQRGADTFGWSRRSPVSRTVHDGDALVGLGIALGTYPTFSRSSSARVSLNTDGTVLVECGATDIGTGTYTILAQGAARVLGVPVDTVTVMLGDSLLPPTPGSGASQAAASTSTAVDAAATALRAKLVATAADATESALEGLRADALAVRGGRVFAEADPERGETFAAIVQRHGEPLVAEVTTEPGVEGYSKHAFGAHFCEVRVDEALGEVRVTRFHGCYGVGRILNAKTARSQFLGGIIQGIGMALMEETPLDPRFGRYVGKTFADYHIPVHADISEVTAEWVEEHDPYINPMGAKGIGEIGIVGVAAAVANAVYNATGRRIRSLPITPEKVLAS